MHRFHQTLPVPRSRIEADGARFAGPGLAVATMTHCMRCMYMSALSKPRPAFICNKLHTRHLVRGGSVDMDAGAFDVGEFTPARMEA